jgi:NADP-dependent 3-hydroxy acid dehydrogenase YdfG
MSQPKTILITGGSGGIGKAIAKTLSADGHRIALVARGQEKLAAAQAEISAPDAQVKAFPCDVVDRAQVKPMLDAVVAALGPIDVLVLSSGINVPTRSLRSIDPADWDKVISTNLNGVFNIVHAALPSMRERGDGLIIQLSSVSGIRANQLAGAAYSASKFAQSALGLVIGREERGRNIRSTVLYPGEVNTPFLDQRAGRPGGDAANAPGGRRESILQPPDIAATVKFLVDLPARAHVPELVIKPTIDDFF